MRLVETVAGEFFHQVEDMGGQVGVDAALDRALHKQLALLGHNLRLLLAHGAAQHVGAAEGVIGQHLSNLHDLFLVENHAVGGAENLFQVGVEIIHLGTAVLAVDKVIHHARLQRPRPEQGHQGNDILEAVGLQTADQILHAA